MLLAFFFGTLQAQTASDAPAISLTTGKFVPAAAQLSDFAPAERNEFGGKIFRLVQFHQIPSEKQRTEWEAAGFLLADYLPTNTFFAVIDQNFELPTIAPFVRAIFQPDARIKKEAPLYFQGIPAHAIEGKEAKLVLTYQAGISAQAVIAALEQKGAKVSAHRDYSKQLDISILATELENIANLPFIQFVGAAETPPINEIISLSWRNPSTRINFLNTNHNGISYNGAGVAIAIGENGSADNNFDLKGRLVELETSAAESHKIGCMQNAASAGNFDPTQRSHAWGASVYSTNNQSYATLINTHNLRYFNHSYGFGISGGYNSAARDHDMRTASYPNHIVSYSSGNDGTSSGYFPYDAFSGWGNLTGVAKHNKNHLAIANLAPDDEILAWGCKGPSFDGRIVPQLTISGPEGTSFASPKAIGIFAVLEEAYKSRNGGLESEATRLKGIVLNTADDMGNAGPDFRTGYGRPNARRAYQVINNAQHFSATVSQGATNAPTNPLALQSGTFKLSSASTITPFTNSTGADLTGLRRLWNNGGIINSGNFSWWANAGVLQNSAGVMNIGSSSGNSITYINNGQLIVEGGEVYIAGRFSPNSGISSGTFQQIGGQITFNVQGSASTSSAPLHINPNASFFMSGGTAIIRRASSSSVGDVVISATTQSVTGGTLQIGDDFTPAAQTIRINSTVPLYNLAVNATNTPTAQLLRSPLTLKNDININSGSTLHSNSFGINIGGNWQNEGNFIAAASSVAFNGANAQNIAGSSMTNFYNLALVNAAGLALAGVDARVEAALTLSEGIIYTGTNLLILSDNATSTGANDGAYVQGKLRKIGNDAFVFPLGGGGFYAPVAISAPADAADHFTAEYFAENANPNYPTNQLQAPIIAVNEREYWVLDRTAGSSSVSVTLSWAVARSGNVAEPVDALVARWDGSQWANHGNTATTGDALAGTLSSDLVGSFSPFALGARASSPIGINLAENGAGIRIYPNPTDAQITIEGSRAAELADFRLLGIDGRDMSALVSIVESEESRLVLDLSKLAAGAYMLKTRTSLRKILKR